MKERKNLFDKALSRVTPESRAHAAFSILAAKRAREIMHDKGITMTDLAGRMKKNISEVSRMLSGMQNLTMKNFVLLNQALGEDVITVTTSAKAKIEVPTGPAGVQCAEQLIEAFHPCAIPPSSSLP